MTEPTTDVEPELLSEYELHPAPADVDVYTAWLAVMRDVVAVAKAQRNRSQNFNFRGIDGVLNAVGPALRRHGVLVMPAGEGYDVEVTRTDYVNDEGKDRVQTLVELTVRWLVLGPQQDVLLVPIVDPDTGELTWVLPESKAIALDSGDKALSKATSIAQREFLLRSLQVPTDEPDPDSESPQAHASRTPAAQGIDYHPTAWLQVAIATLPDEATAQLGPQYKARVGSSYPMPGDPKLRTALALVRTFVNDARAGRYGEWDDGLLRRIEQGESPESVAAELPGAEAPEPEHEVTADESSS